jgi:hypothetical protein
VQVERQSDFGEEHFSSPLNLSDPTENVCDAPGQSWLAGANTSAEGLRTPPVSRRPTSPAPWAVLAVALITCGARFEAEPGTAQLGSVLIEEPIETISKLGAVLLDVGPQRRDVAGQRPNILG